MSTESLGSLYLRTLWKMNFYRKNDIWPPATSDFIVDVVITTYLGVLLIFLSSDQILSIRHKIYFSAGP